MGLRLKGQVLKFDVVDKCNRKFASDCEVTFPEKVPVTYNFSLDEIIGHAGKEKKFGGSCMKSVFWMKLSSQSTKRSSSTNSPPEYRILTKQSHTKRSILP